MKKEFSLEHGGPKRIRVTWAGKLKNTEVFFDGAKIASFATANDFGRGTTVKLADGSLLTVRWGPVAGIPILKGVHLVRNGLPIPGSAADPLPTWAWPFIIACAVIPVVTLGGALPALIGFGGASGTMTISRLNKWSRTMRGCLCGRDSTLLDCLRFADLQRSEDQGQPGGRQRQGPECASIRSCARRQRTASAGRASQSLTLRY